MHRKRGIRRPSRRHKACLPSTYIQTAEAIRPGTKVVLWCRVSSGLQNSKGNNADQEAELRTAVKARGGIIVGVVHHAGRVIDAKEGLCQAVNLAESFGAVLLAESTSRFVRHPDYHSKLRPHLTPTAIDLSDLRWICGNVKLVTLLDPDATWRDERAHQSKRGQRRKGKPGGRPTTKQPGYKKRFRLRSQPKVRWMKWVGMSNRSIAKAIGTHEKNVRRWGAAFLRYEQADDGN